MQIQMFEEVIQYVFEHSQLPYSTVCKLLCCSEATAAAVHTNLAGTLQLKLKRKPAGKEQFRSWLSKRASLLHSLHLDDGFDTMFTRKYSFSAESTTAAGRLAAALATAAALPGGLQLQSLQTISLPVLRAASCRTLTYLDLCLDKDMLFPSVQEAAAAITGLGSQLRSLELHACWTLFDSNHRESAQFHFGPPSAPEPDCGLHMLMQQALPQLTALTRLVVEEVADASVFKYAPPQLLELEAVGADDQSDTPLELGHLTACTSLLFYRNHDYYQEGWRQVGPDDTLPLHLRELWLTDCTSAAPLLPLTQLTELTIGQHCHMPAAELQRLSAMTQLQTVRLGYNVYRGSGGESDAQVSSGGWEYVPALHELELQRQSIDPACDLLKHLGSCTDLTRLVWGETSFREDMDAFMKTPAAAAALPTGEDPEFPDAWYEVKRDCGVSALGAALPRSLRELDFGGLYLAPDTFTGQSELSRHKAEGDAVMGLRAMAKAVAGLPDLVSVKFGDVDCCEFAEAGQQLIARIVTYMKGCGHGEGDTAAAAAGAGPAPEGTGVACKQAWSSFDNEIFDVIWDTYLELFVSSDYVSSDYEDSDSGGAGDGAEGAEDSPAGEAGDGAADDLAADGESA